MRTYGRNSQGQWIEVDTLSTGDSSMVWLTTFVQCLKLNLGESPFWGNYGLPSLQSVQSQVAPDVYVAQMQAAFSQYFVSLSVSRQLGSITPIYNITAIMNNGSIVSTQVAT